MTLMQDELLQHYQQAWQRRFANKTRNWLNAFRQQAIKDFLTVGFPHHRDELWKYTNLDPIKKQLFNLSKNFNNINPEQIKHLFLARDNYRLTFVDGIFAPELSLTPANQQFIITDFASLIEAKEHLVQSSLTDLKHASGFTHLNTAQFEQGVFIHIPENCSIDKPVQLLFLATDAAVNNLHNFRNVIKVDKNARLTLFEQHYSFNQARYLTNIVTQLVVKEAATVEYIKLQNQHTDSFHIAHTELSQETNSELNVHYYSLGSELSRDDVHSFLKETGAKLTINGLYLPFSKQHIDIHTFVYHQADNTVSNENIKGVVAGKSRAVFNGKIRVEKNIKKTVANLQNKNLLLAKNAEVNTKPELEIYSDDVICKHGATLGQMDKEMLFYLCSRGIDKQAAYRLLLLAFVQENLTTMVDASIAETITKLITRRCEEVDHD